MTEIALLSPVLRLIIVGVAVVLLGIALVLRWRKLPGGLPLAVIGLAGLILLAAERAIALVVTGAAPAGAAYNEWRWVVSAPWGRLGMAVGALAAMVTIWFSWRGTAREPVMWRRVLLVSLRAGACGAALILFLEPALELRHVTREPNHVAILVDDSRSMALGEKKDGPTRAERAAEFLRRSEPTFATWRDQHQLDFFTFSEGAASASATQLETKITPRGDATQLREAIETVRSRYDARDLAGIVVVSDGTPTGRFADGVDDGASQDFLAGLGVKVHTAWVGRAGLKDLAVAKILADDFAFVRTAVKIDAVIRQTGLAPQDVPVVLRRDGKVVGQTTVHLGGSTAEARASFSIVPELIGKYVFEVSVPVLPEEVVPENNKRAFVMRVTRDKTRVLQVAGRPSWDERALRGFFKADPNVDLISFFILRTSDDIALVPAEEMSLIPFPTQELFEQQLGSFDVVILQDFEPAPYRISPYLDNIRQYVENGGALVMLGGSQSFSSGGYYGTPVAEALPVDLLPRGPDPERLVSTDEFHPQLTEEGASHPVMQLRFDRHDNVARWAGLPPLEGVNLVAGAKQGAQVLAEHPSLRGRNGQPLPVIVAGEYGKGRTLSIATDSIWRWGFMAAGQEGDDGRAYQKFWENTVRWLSRDPELEYLHVDSEQAEYGPGVAPRLRARLVDKDYRPAPSGDVKLEVVCASTDCKPLVSKTVNISDGEAQLEIAPLPPGAYRLVGKTMMGDRQITADDVFLVDPEREELERPAAREDILRAIAKATGGEYLGDADHLPSSLELTPPRIVRVDKRSDVELWSRPHLFILALALLGAEWAFRRRRGFL